MASFFRVGDRSSSLMTLTIGHWAGGPHPGVMLSGLKQLWLDEQPLLITAVVAIEASAWLHLIQDGDPMPLPPRR